MEELNEEETEKDQSEDQLALDFIRIAVKRLDQALDDVDEKENRALAVEDLEFLNGNQWSEDVKAEREAAGRPCLTINKVVEKVDQVIGDERRMRPGIKVVPNDDQSSVENAEILNGVIRTVEASSMASVAYDHAFEHAVACGYGAFRIDLEENESDTTDLSIAINRIENAFQVVWDPASKKADKSDARYCFVFEDIQRDVYEELLPGKTPIAFKATEGGLRNWATKDTVRIAEYWQREKIRKTIYTWADGQTTDFLIDGHDPVSAKETTAHIVKWTKIDGAQILEPTIEWIGSYIPIIAVEGKELNIDGKKSKRGMVRHAKDPNRAYNYSRSSAIEITALAPKTPWLVTAKMISPYLNMWANAFKKTFPYLLYEPDPAAPGSIPKREQPAQIPTGDLQLAQIASDEIKATTGIYDASLGAKSNETSGRAIRERKIEGDTATFAYIDNLIRAMTYAGKVLVDLIPKINHGPRTLKLTNPDKSIKFQKINQILRDSNGQPIMGEDGKPKIIDLTSGKYNVIVDPGPSFTTQRQEAREGMVDFAAAIPGAGQLMGDMIASNSDWPNADALSKRLKFLLPPEIRQAEEMEQAQEGGEQKFDPMQIQRMIQQASQKAVAQFIQSAEGQKLMMENEKHKALAETANTRLEIERVKTAREGTGGIDPQEFLKMFLQSLVIAKQQGLV